MTEVNARTIQGNFNIRKQMQNSVSTIEFNREKFHNWTNEKGKVIMTIGIAIKFIRVRLF